MGKFQKKIDKPISLTTKNINQGKTNEKLITVKNPIPAVKQQNIIEGVTSELKQNKTQLTLLSEPKNNKNKLKKHENDLSAKLKEKRNLQNKLIQNSNKKKANEKIKFSHIKFDQQNFEKIITLENVEKAVIALTKIVKEESSKLKNCIFSDYRYVLNVACFKIPNCPKRIVKLRLKHSLVAEDDDVVLIVKDLRRGAKIDYEPTIHHWEDLLRKHGVTGIKAIVPMNQLKKEYTTYETKIKFSNMYEHYLCEAPISSHVVSFLGNACSHKTRSSIYAVRTQNLNNLKNEINKALSKTCYHQGQKGNMISIPIATDKMNATEVAENLLKVVEELKTIYVGGLPNIRNMHLRINLKGTSAIPIYISLAEPPSKTPYIIGPREKRLAKLKDQTDDILMKFEITKTGDVVKLDNKAILLKRAASDIDIKAPSEKKIKNVNSDEKSIAENGVRDKLGKSEKSDISEEEIDRIQHKNEDDIKVDDSDIEAVILYEDDEDYDDETEDENSEDYESEDDDNEDEDNDDDSGGDDMNEEENNESDKDAVSDEDDDDVEEESSDDADENENI